LAGFHWILNHWITIEAQDLLFDLVWKEEKQQLMAFRRRMLRNLTGQESGAKEE